MQVFRPFVPETDKGNDLIFSMIVEPIVMTTANTTVTGITISAVNINNIKYKSLEREKGMQI